MAIELQKTQCCGNEHTTEIRFPSARTTQQKFLQRAHYTTKVCAVHKLHHKRFCIVHTTPNNVFAACTTQQKFLQRAHYTRNVFAMRTLHDKSSCNAPTTQHKFLQRHATQQMFLLCTHYTILFFCCVHTTKQMCFAVRTLHNKIVFSAHTRPTQHTFLQRARYTTKVFAACTLHNKHVCNAYLPTRVTQKAKPRQECWKYTV